MIKQSCNKFHTSFKLDVLNWLDSDLFAEKLIFQLQRKACICCWKYILEQHQSSSWFTKQHGSKFIGDWLLIKTEIINWSKIIFINCWKCFVKYCWTVANFLSLSIILQMLGEYNHSVLCYDHALQAKPGFEQAVKRKHAVLCQQKLEQKLEAQHR